MGVDEVNTNTQDRIDQMDAVALDAITASDVFLSSLSEQMQISDLPFITAPQAWIDPAPIPLEVTVPVWEGVPAFNPDRITDPNITTPTIDHIVVPEFTTEEPEIDLPTIPGVEDKLPEVPTEPTIEEVTVPSRPIVEYPTPPTVTQYTIPSAPSIAIPNFTGVLPADVLEAPTGELEWSEEEYISSLLTSVKAKLKNDVDNGGTGLGEAIIDQIWDWRDEKNSIVLEDSINKTISTWSKRGFSLPSGVLDAKVDAAYLEYETKRLDKEREIAEKEADLAQKNTHFAIEQSIRLEDILIRHHDIVSDRALLAAKSVVEISIAIFNSKVAHYNAQLEAYRTQAQVYETLVRSEGLKIDLFKSQIEATKLQYEAQAQAIELYKARVSAYEALLNMYKVDMEAANIRMGIEKMKVEIYRAQVDAYLAQINAVVAEYQAYKIRTEGEATKAQVYATLASAYNSKVQGVKAQSDVSIAEARTRIDKERLELEKYAQQISKYRADIEYHLANVRTIIEKYGLDVNLYTADSNRAEANARIRLGQQQIIANNLDSNLKVTLESAAQNLQAFINHASIKVHAATSGGNIYSAYVSAALNSISAVMQLLSQGIDTRTE